MITAKRLLPERKESNQVVKEATIQAEETQLHRLVKLVILLLLSYVIIFM